MLRFVSIFVVSLAGALAASCGGMPATGAEKPTGGASERATEVPAGRRFTVHAALDPALETVDVTVCFAGAAPESLFCPRSSAARAVTRAEVRTPGAAPAELRMDGSRLFLPERLPDDACVGYVVDLDRAMNSSFFGGARVGEAALVGAAAWLWQPSPMQRDDTGVLTFDLPAGFDAAVPFPEAEGGEGYVLDRSVYNYLAHTVMGRFERRLVEADGAELTVVKMPGRFAATDEDLDRFVTNVSGMVSTIHGHFPAPRALVVLVPIGPGSGIAFGNVGRGGGASVMLLVREGSTYEALMDDWVPPHELSHLTVPYVERSDSWLSEGLATYYQEVLRVRGGVRTPLEGWRRLDEGFATGRRDGAGLPLERESEQMFVNRTFRRVYWAGTAMALMADVELRKHEKSLDEAIRGLAACCTEEQRSWRGREMAETFDRVTGVEAYGPLMEEHLASRDFPDLTEVYAYLGLRRADDGDLELVDDAPGIAIRDAIMPPGDGTQGLSPPSQPE